MPITIFIVDDHKVFRQGIASLIGYEEDMQVIGTAESVQEFMDNILDHEPDVILMDITLKDGEGTDATKWLREKRPDCKILMLSMHREDKYIRKVLDCGADGYMLKDAGTDEMMIAIRAIHQGQTYYSHQITQAIIQQMVSGKTPKKELVGQALSRRELEVLKHIAEEKGNKEIADLLFISVRTVDAHRRHLLEKLQVKNTAGLVKHAIRMGLIDL